MEQRRRILLFAEAVTLAHLARPMALAMGLDTVRFEIVLACSPAYRSFSRHLPWTYKSLNSISSQDFMAALAQGRPAHDVNTLRAYVQEDLSLMEEMRPDLVVGDFRLSLSVSARLAKIPYFAISSAYWSPFARQKFPLPELPFTPILGLALSNALFQAARPLAFAYHTLPLNRVRRENGLQSLGVDLCRTYTDADVTLYADVPEMVPTYELPANHRYLGPVLWSPAVPAPGWWNRLPQNRPIIYVTLGSSGQQRLLNLVLEALAALPVTVMAATAGHPVPDAVSPNSYLADYLPGREAASRAKLVICNGGSPTSHQALAAGVPVLGIAGNIDQFLNMQAVERVGAGIVVRGEQASSSLIRASVTQVLDNPAYAEAAVALAQVFARYNAPERFARNVSDALGLSASVVRSD